MGALAVDSFSEIDQFDYGYQVAAVAFCSYQCGDGFCAIAAVATCGVDGWELAASVPVAEGVGVDAQGGGGFSDRE